MNFAENANNEKCPFLPFFPLKNESHVPLSVLYVPLSAFRLRKLFFSDGDVYVCASYSKQLFSFIQFF